MHILNQIPIYNVPVEIRHRMLILFLSHPSEKSEKRRGHNRSQGGYGGV